MRSDELFMQRAIELAKKGIGHVSPNPQVGCVIVHDGRIIGEGWHHKYGGPHAEVMAIESVKEKSLLKESEVFVNLEPCSHFGKTPPCADLLTSMGVKKVIISNIDINPLVGGKGIKKLVDSGIEVTTGTMEAAGLDLNRRFFTFLEKQRPYIILKWAQTSDGFIARSNYESKWISNETSRQIVHRWRSEEDAVLTGTKTTEVDNPKLNVRDWSGRNPVRIVIDRSLRLPASLHVFDGSQPSICYNTIKSEETTALSFVRLDETAFLEQMMKDLVQRKIQSMMVEGGSMTLNLFFNAGLWDELRIFESPVKFGSGIAAPVLPSQSVLNESITIPNNQPGAEPDVLNIYRHGKN